MKTLQGKVVLITGASEGIGLSVARAFARVGSEVILAARRKRILAERAAEITRGGGLATAIPVDMGDSESIECLVNHALARKGRIDILVNNAGVGLVSPVATLRIADLERVFAVNVAGPVRLIQTVLPSMVTNGTGTIINILSINARRTMPNSGGYSASKAALEMLADSLRMEIKDTGVNVVSVFPGFTRTSFAENVLGEKPKGRGKRLAVSPDAVARAVVRSARNGSRDVYVTAADRFGVWAATQFPKVADWAMGRLWATGRD